MLHSIEVRLRPDLADYVGRRLAERVRVALGFAVESVRVVKVFIVEGLEQEEARKAVDEAALHDPVLQEASLLPFASDADWILEVGFRPGVTDNEGRTARDTLALVLGKQRDFSVYTAVRYHMRARLSRQDVERIASDLLANDLIQRSAVKEGAAWRKKPGFPLQAARVTGAADNEVSVIPLSSMNDEELVSFSKANTLALSLEEMRAVAAHYADPGVLAARASAGFPADPTDAEMEVLAQTWSEHCKHKIFAAAIDYENTETGCREHIDGLYSSCIQNTTEILRQKMGDRDFCRSVFTDNAGVVAFTDSHDICIKVETHNSPSALDPYGGALTGIVGVNRDPMGTGLGAELVCNTDVFCFASPFYDGQLPPRLLHPRRIMEGVREGVEHGGNKSGVPTVNGSVVFDERYLGKPLVYCGTVGILPRVARRRAPDATGRGRSDKDLPGYYKKANVGDVVVMAGGRIGKDGIHGATFSSEALHEGSPATAVQIGDPITQRKLYDCIIKARDLGLYTAITDNGAGGLSSSVGEMAGDTGGCRIDLAKAPLKYDGLRPWEILLSEAQERMTLAVPEEHVSAFLQLAEEMDVEAAALGEFTDSGYFHVTYADAPVACLPMDFMHDGVPRMRLEARWERPLPHLSETPLPGRMQSAPGRPEAEAASLESRVNARGFDQASLLLTMLGRLNICSKEYLIRQYDHEVKGGSVIKPLVGALRDGPGDAAVLRPLLDSRAGIVLSHGICPKFSDADTYWMAANAIDEAVRNAVAVGADPARLAGVDNFCWCDPVQSENTPDGRYKLAQLVRACKALRHFCLGYGIPCVSGKDSMKNDYTGGGAKISIPPTLLFSVLGVIPDVTLAVSSDFKRAGDAVYLLGLTGDALAGSEIASELGLTGGTLPQPDVLSAGKRYALVHKAITMRLLSACHDLSDGGLAVALAEMALGGRLGARVNLDRVPWRGPGFHAAARGESRAAALTGLLYAESAGRLLVTVPRDHIPAFQDLFKDSLGFDAALIGNVSDLRSLIVTANDTPVLELPVDALAGAFKATLDW
ncbi:MAG: phosphoribosylformylglycinamidine synthase [Desulfovibrio sp.]|jgi:phosphoribosylformylglycinamidine synthase|nr:phosphoribosylformylglycinamidine synthase [Desulfovibrio sp.]